MKRVIRTDQFGPYVLTGGYAFRPLEVANKFFFPHDPLYAKAARNSADDLGVDLSEVIPTRLRHANVVHAQHIGGTTAARVGGEVWFSSSIDPRWKERTGSAAMPQVGSRVRVTGRQRNDPAPLRVGDEGTVVFIDDAGTLHTNWDSGRSLGLLVGDPYEVIS